MLLPTWVVQCFTCQCKSEGLLQFVEPVPSSNLERVVFAIEQALKWTALDDMPDEMWEPLAVRSSKDLAVMA